VGRRDEALARVQEAVTICRRLAEAAPETYLPDLAAALDILANRLADTGRREEALATAQEASDHCRRLAEAWPDRFGADAAAAAALLKRLESG
jgi:hypothetical protein